MDALALCRLLVRDGFTDVVATPHVLGRYDGFNWAQEVRTAAREMQAVLQRERVPLTIHPGAEVRIDERIQTLLESDRLLTLGDGGEYMLLELPTASYVSPHAVVEVLSRSGINIVLAHAERYESLRRDPMSAQQWVEAGVILQVNAPSLLGEAPAGATDAAMYWIQQGWVSLVATDSHSANSRRPRMTEAIEMLEREFGLETARKLCATNPLRVLEGEDGNPPTTA
jgi:protein-tyrosine phosphatase